MEMRQKKKIEDPIYLRTGSMMNIIFTVPTAITLWYIFSNFPPSLWGSAVLLISLAGLSYRETWTFSREEIRFRFSLFLLPVQRKSIIADNVKEIHLKTFIRGQNEPTEPGKDRKWYQTVQGILLMRLSDDSEETLLMETNKKTIKLGQKGEEIASFLRVPFLINKE